MKSLVKVSSLIRSRGSWWKWIVDLSLQDKSVSVGPLKSLKTSRLIDGHSSQTQKNQASWLLVFLKSSVQFPINKAPASIRSQEWTLNYNSRSLSALLPGLSLWIPISILYTGVLRALDVSHLAYGLTSLEIVIFLWTTLSELLISMTWPHWVSDF